LFVYCPNESAPNNRTSWILLKRMRCTSIVRTLIGILAGRILVRMHSDRTCVLLPDVGLPNVGLPDFNHTVIYQLILLSAVGRLLPRLTNNQLCSNLALPLAHERSNKSIEWLKHLPNELVGQDGTSFWNLRYRCSSLALMRGSPN
jgi:hypothetical protein